MSESTKSSIVVEILGLVKKNICIGGVIAMTDEEARPLYGLTGQEIMKGL